RAARSTPGVVTLAWALATAGRALPLGRRLPRRPLPPRRAAAARGGRRARRRRHRLGGVGRQHPGGAPRRTAAAGAGARRGRRRLGGAGGGALPRLHGSRPAHPGAAVALAAAVELAAPVGGGGSP